MFQGSLFFTTYSGAVEAEMLNRIGLDAMVYGNHEFDLGPEALAKFIEAAEFPVLSGNVDVSADNLLAPLAEDHLVLEIGGEKVAILGAMTPDTAEISSPGPTVGFRPPVEYLTAKVAELEAEGVDKVILLSHLGAFATTAVAACVPGIDLIVGGHRHTLFSNTAEGAPFKYPLMVDGPDGKAGADRAGRGLLQVPRPRRAHLRRQGLVTEATGDTQVLDASVTPDAATLDRIKELAGPIEELKGRKVAEIAAGIDGSRETCRAQECQMGNLVTDAMLDRVKSQGVTIAITNGGGLRASIGGGTVTMGDVLAVLPFQNTLVDLQHPGLGHRRGAGERLQPGRGGGGALPAGLGPALHLGPEGAGQQPGQDRRGPDGDALGAARPGRGLFGRQQQLHAQRRRRLHLAARRGDPGLRLRPGARGRAGGLSGGASGYVAVTEGRITPVE